MAQVSIMLPVSEIDGFQKIPIGREDMLAKKMLVHRALQRNHESLSFSFNIRLSLRGVATSVGNT